MLKIGIAGARGLSAMTGFQSLPEVEVAALCDLKEELLDRESKKYGIKKAFRVFEDMLADDIDAVVIATPMQLHVAQRSPRCRRENTYFPK